MDVSDIGSTDDTALLCITNRTCLTKSNDSGGDWFAPNGDRVMFSGAPNVTPGLTRNRAPMVVRLKRSPDGGVPTEGIYRCVIGDNQDIHRTLYVGLYTAAERGIIVMFLF